MNDSSQLPARGLTGVFPILSMPFTPRETVDEESLQREVEWAVTAGVDGLGLALASEMPRLTRAERSRAITLVVEQSRGRVPLVVAASGESVNVAAEFATDAEKHGAAALMIHPPTFEATSPCGQWSFFDALLRATTLPVFLQDLPTARLNPNTVTKLSRDHPGRIALKLETPPTPSEIANAVLESNGRLAVFGGAGGMLFHSELLSGASGTMPGCVLPEAFVTVWQQYTTGDADAARHSFARIVPFLIATSRPGLMFSFYREALVFRGVFQHRTARTPGVELGEADRRELQTLLEDLDLPDIPVV